MALITKAVVNMELVSVPECASNFFIYVPAIYLSIPYELATGDCVVGDILSVTAATEEISQLRNTTDISFILERGVVNDKLFIHKSDWTNFFRDWGLVTPGYTLELKLNRAIEAQTKTHVTLYPRKDFKF